MTKTHPRARLLAAALAIAVSAPAAAAGSPYSQTVFFGDSLTDAGYFRPLLPVSVQPVTGQFTTNPGFVWAQYLADFYGTSAGANGNGQNGTDYAAGGAQVGVDTSGALGPIPSLATQVGSYLAANGGRADPNALYTVWGGANDLFTVTNGGADPNTTIAAAVGAEVGIVGQLQAAGARYILVAAIPDLGLTPAFRAQGATAQAQGTALAQSYNDALFTTLAGSGLRVIPLDTFHFLQEIVNAPSTYGFSNVTGTACQPQITANSLTCNPTSYVSPTAPNDYVFADGVHPTSPAHAILAQYAESVLEGPRQIAVLPYAESIAGRSRSDRISAYLQAPAAGDGWRWWSDVRGDLPHYDRNGAGTTFHGHNFSLSAGVAQTTGALTWGGYLDFGHLNMDFGQDFGGYDRNSLTLGGYLGWRGEHAWANGQLSYGRQNYDVNRQVPLGPAIRHHTGSPGGDALAAALDAGWDFTHGALRHGPVASLAWQKINVDAYAENDPNLSTSLAYPQQGFDSLVGSVGWQASYAINAQVRPYARLTADREFHQPDAEAFASAQSLPGTLPYAVPGLNPDRSYASLTVGAQTTLFGLDGNVGVVSTVGQRGANNASVFVTLGGAF
jgi:outer membrane lipase/esterase